MTFFQFHMSTYFLDTSVLIDILRGKEEVGAFLTKHPQDSFITSCICVMEIYLGLYLGKSEFWKSKKEQADRLFSSLYEVLAFDSRQTETAAKIKAQLIKEGNLIDDLDILIAASVLGANATLLTKNTKHFSRVKELVIHNFT